MRRPRHAGGRSRVREPLCVRHRVQGRQSSSAARVHGQPVHGPAPGAGVVSRAVDSASGMDEVRLARLMEAMREDIERDRYFGGVIAIGRHGRLALHEAVGHADSTRTRPVKKDSVFSLFSTTKAITGVLVLRAIERGQLALTTPISDVVPEFSGRGREAITIYHLLTHSSGLPSVWSAR